MRRLAITLFVVWACSCGVSGHVPFGVQWRLMEGNPAYAASTETWAQTWQAAMNKAWRSKQAPLRMSSARCVLHDGVEICSFRLSGKGDGGKPCWAALVHTDGDVVVDPKGALYMHSIGCNEVRPNTHLVA
ncbi:MAG TPA: hypothetical protein VG265_07260 [Gaiellaceae bacterium]|jgi:hypothetical protein|nr:hypothetical protein [Gaiellaceae bacterium]